MINEKYELEIKKAIKIREVEYALLNLFNEGKLNGTVHTCIGQEFTGVFISKFLKSSDHVVSNHRGHGHYLSRHDNIKGLMSELMGKKSGCSGGIGGSQHIVDENYMSNGIQGGMVPIAAGVSLYYKHNQKKSISVAFIGDGTLGEGIIYETFNIASLLKLPLLVVLENNGISQSTSHDQNFSGDIKKRVLGFGMKYYQTSTDDINDLDSVCSTVFNDIRKNSHPILLEIKTNRLKSHSKGDDNRNKDYVSELNKNDFLTTFYNSENIFTTYIKQIRSEIKDVINEINSEKFLINYRVDPNSELLTKKRLENINVDEMPVGRYNNAINSALDAFLSKSDSIILGEDIEDSNDFNPGEYGGAFKVTKGLSHKYKDYIINTPISEAAITGIGSGYCIAGGNAIVEIMFGDFMTLILDQLLQHTSKFELMYNRKVTCPLIIRSPMGGKRGYGPTHSQSIEKHFMGIQNLGVVALNHRISPNYVLKAIKSLDSMPFIILENKILYTLKCQQEKIPNHTYFFNESLFPDLIIKSNEETPVITVICYGEVLNELEKAYFQLILEEEIFIEIICPSLISPINISNISKSLSSTQKLLIIEEGSGNMSWGSEIVSLLVESDVHIKKLSRINNNLLIPSSFKAEIANLVNVDTIKNEIIKLIDNA